MWVWDQSSGTLTRNGQLISKGYSGFQRGKNNPSMQAAIGVGPIPRGRWKITEKYDSANVGKYALKLEPVGHNALGRSAFRVHGDSIANPGTASHGCVILPLTIRQKIWTSGDRDLEVVE